MSELIRLEMRDWLYNAGLLGVYRILKHNNEYVKVGINYIEFYESSLDGFGIKYFNYLIDKYEDFTKYNKILKREYLVNNYDEEKLNELNELIKDIKDTLKVGRYASACVSINDDSIIKLAKNINKIEGDNTEEELNKLKELFEHMKRDEVKREMIIKDINYMIITHFWNTRAFMGKVKILSNVAYDDDIIAKVKKQLKYEAKENKKLTKNNLVCISCNTIIENKGTSSDLTWLKYMGVDKDRKTSMYWQHNSIAICPLCTFVYTCIPCGFNVLPRMMNKDEVGLGLFINQNSSFDNLIKSNNIELNDDDNLNMLVNKGYHTLLDTLNQNDINSSNKQYSNIQVIKLKDGMYHNDIASKNVLKILDAHKEELSKIVNTTIKVNKDVKIELHKEIIDRLCRGQNLCDLIQKAIYYYIKGKFNYLYAINVLLEINNDFININKSKGDVIMKSNEISSVKFLGVRLHDEYVKIGMSNKIDGMVFRLSNAINIGDKDTFVSNIIRFYTYLNNSNIIKDLSWFDKILNDDVDVATFKQFGHAFLIGLIVGTKKQKDE